MTRHADRPRRPGPYRRTANVHRQGGVRQPRSAPPSSGTTSSSTAPPPPWSSARCSSPTSDPITAHAAGVRHLRARVRRPPARRRGLRPLRRPGRPQEDAGRLAADDGAGHGRDRPAADVRRDRRRPPRSCCWSAGWCRASPSAASGAARCLMAAEHGRDEPARLLVLVAAGRRPAGQPARDRRAVRARAFAERRDVRGVGLADPVPALRACSSLIGLWVRLRSRSRRLPGGEGRDRRPARTSPRTCRSSRWSGPTPRRSFIAMGMRHGREHRRTTSSRSSRSPTSRRTSTRTRTSC